MFFKKKKPKTYTERAQDAAKQVVNARKVFEDSKKELEEAIEHYANVMDEIQVDIDGLALVKQGAEKEKNAAEKFLAKVAALLDN